MGRPKKQDAGDTRERIIDSALKLFAEGSYHGTSMRQVAKAVGVRESALYHHFPSKEAILEELLKRYGPSRALALASVDFSYVEQLGVKAFIQQMTRFLMQVWYEPKEIQFARMMIGEGTRLGLPEKNHPRHAIAGAQHSMRALLEELMKRKLIRKGNAEAYLYAFMGPIMLIRLQHQLLKDTPTPMAQVMPLVEEHLENFWRVIAPDKK